MSGPPTALPPEIAELMTVPVTWEHFEGFDGNVEPSFADPVTLMAWVEPAGQTVGGVTIERKADGNMVEPQYVLYFDGDDVTAQEMSVYDRFTLPIVGATNMPLQPLRVGTLDGPNFDNQTPWLIEVVL